MLNNIGILLFLKGTQITWNVYTRDVSAVKFEMPSEVINLEKKECKCFAYSKKFLDQSNILIPGKRICAEVRFIKAMR